MKKKTLAELDEELSNALYAYIDEAGLEYTKRYLKIEMHNQKEFRKVFCK